MNIGCDNLAKVKKNSTINNVEYRWIQSRTEGLWCKRSRWLSRCGGLEGCRSFVFVLSYVVESVDGADSLYDLRVRCECV